jgi:hypothetical protein
MHKLLFSNVKYNPMGWLSFAMLVSLSTLIDYCRYEKLLIAYATALASLVGLEWHQNAKLY